MPLVCVCVASCAACVCVTANTDEGAEEDTDQTSQKTEVTDKTDLPCLQVTFLSVHCCVYSLSTTVFKKKQLYFSLMHSALIILSYLDLHAANICSEMINQCHNVTTNTIDSLVPAQSSLIQHHWSAASITACILGSFIFLLFALTEKLHLKQTFETYISFIIPSRLFEQARPSLAQYLLLNE